MNNEKVAKPFATIASQIAEAAQAFPEKVALVDDHHQITYRELISRIEGVAASLLASGTARGDVLAICARNSMDYALIYLAATSVGIIVAPLPVAATPDDLLGMLSDCRPRKLFVDDASIELFPDEMLLKFSPPLQPERLASALDRWRSASESCEAEPARPDDIFNIIYSSGTTGVPKGIVQTHQMRSTHIQLGQNEGHDAQTVNLLSTPLYSNTTLISFFPTLALGGTVILMSKFDCGTYLALAERYRATHTMLVPVQYMRLMNHDGFDQFDLHSFRHKYCTSAPFPAALKKEVLERWPGGLTEYYGMTEGGGLCILRAHEQPDKLGTVGRPVADCDMRLIDENGHQLPSTSEGEIVGSSNTMMQGYLNQPELSKQALWISPDGITFIRTGDIGRFDSDGFLYLLDRKKDIIISGGFNIYPVDIENVLRSHSQVTDVAVFGVPSETWGETPVAYVVAPGANEQEIKAFVNKRIGKMQRVSDLKIVDQIPRSPIGKIQKKHLRTLYANDGMSL